MHEWDLGHVIITSTVPTSVFLWGSYQANVWLSTIATVNSMRDVTSNPCEVTSGCTARRPKVSGCQLMSLESSIKHLFIRLEQLVCIKLAGDMISNWLGQLKFGVMF